MKNKELLFRITLVLVSGFITLTIAEVGYRFLLGEQHEYSVSPTGNQYKFYQFDPKLGWANTPHASGTYRRSEYAYRVSINEHGMRQRQVSKEKTAGTFRIAVLGDSFVWGIGINDGRRLTEVLEGMLPDTEVLNFGVSGYSPVQYLLMIDNVIEFQPDLVVIVFCLGNDFADNVLYQRYGYYKPYAALDENGGLDIRGYPLPNTRKFGFRKSGRLFGSVLLGELRNKYLLSSLQQAGLARFTNGLLHLDDEYLSVSQRQMKQEAIRINEALFSEIQKTLNENNTALVISATPTKREYNKLGKYGHQDYYPVAESQLQQSGYRVYSKCI